MELIPERPHEPAQPGAPTADTNYSSNPPVPRFCNGLTRQGLPCTFSARRASSFCVNHDPAYAAQQRANVLKGAARSVSARRSHAHIPTEHFDLSTHGGIQAVLDAVIRLELAGRLPDRRSRNLIRALSLASRNIGPASKEAYRQQHQAGLYQNTRRLFDRHLESLCLEADAHDDRRSRKPGA